MTAAGSLPAARTTPPNDAAAASALTLAAMARFADRSLVGLMLATAVALPLVFSIAGQDVFALPKSVTLWVISIFAGILLIVRLAGERSTRLRAAPIWMLFGTWILLNVVGWWLSVDRDHSLIGESLQYQGVVSIMCYALSLVVAAAALGRPGRVRLFLLAIVVGAIPVAGYAVIQWLRLDPIWPYLPKGRAFSTLGQANALGAYLVIAIAASLGLLGSSGRLARGVMVPIVALLCAAVAFTLSRGAYLGLLAMIIVFGVGVGLPLLVRILRAPKLGLAAGAIVIAAAGMAAMPTLEPFVLRATSTVDLAEDSVLGHFDLWTVGARMVADHPLIGTGQDTFVLEFGHYRDLALSPDRAWIMAKYRPESPHNVYLAIAGGTGLPSLAAYLGIVGLAVTGILRLVRRTSCPRDAWLLTALAAAIAGHLVTDAFVTAELTSTWLLWVILGLAIGNSTQRDAAAGPSLLSGRAVGGALSGSQ